MLRPCSKDEFNSFIDLAYSLALDPERSGYPSYRDGIKTKEAFIERSYKAFERDTEELLLFVHEGEVRGLIHYYWLPEDGYLQTICFNIAEATGEALSEFLEYVGERFKGYEVMMGFPAENGTAVDWLSSHGLECIESDFNNTAFLDRLGDIPEPGGVIRIGRENYELFRTLHVKIEGDMYWNSERILADIDNWIIFVREKDGAPQGAVYFTELNEGWFEIFGIDLDQGQNDPDTFKELLSAALADAKRRNGRFMTFFCEEEHEAAAQECGFECIGGYRCFTTRIE